MFLQFNTSIPFRKRTAGQPGEIIKVRDGSGRIVETWECVGSSSEHAEFHADSYQDARSI